MSPRADDGTWPVVLITEGEGSTGRYSGELLERSASIFSGTASYMDHPIDPEHPEKRSVLSIAGRFGEVTVGEDKGKKALLSTFKPRAEYASFVEEFHDVLGLSIYCPAKGEVMEDGRLDVQEFVPSPYRSVDIVVAAGRGGRIKQARESLLVIESSLGEPAESTKPGAAPVPGTPTTQEERMDTKDIQAIAAAVAEAFKPVVTLLEEQKVAIEALKAGAPAPAAPKETKDAVKDAIEALKKIDAAGIDSPTLRESLIVAIAEGEDASKAIEFAKKVVSETKKTPAETYIAESQASDKTHDFRVTRLIGA